MTTKTIITAAKTVPMRGPIMSVIEVYVPRSLFPVSVGVVAIG